MRILSFPGTHPVGKPKDWIPELDGNCGTIHVLTHFDELLGYNIQYSVYMPTDADRAAIAAGGGIRLGIHGDGHPVFQLGVLTHARMEQLEYVEHEDLGEPI